MTCATCQHYRPARGRFGRCSLTGEHVRHDHRCSDHADAEVESVADWLARNGRPHTHRGGEGIEIRSGQMAQSRQHAERIRGGRP